MCLCLVRAGGAVKDQRLAVHRSIVVVDVEGFGDQRRTNAHQVTVRDGLYGVMREAFGWAGWASPLIVETSP